MSDITVVNPWAEDEDETPTVDVGGSDVPVAPNTPPGVVVVNPWASDPAPAPFPTAPPAPGGVADLGARQATWINNEGIIDFGDGASWDVSEQDYGTDYLPTLDAYERAIRESVTGPFATEEDRLAAGYQAVGQGAPTLAEWAEANFNEYQEQRRTEAFNEAFDPFWKDEEEGDWTDEDQERLLTEFGARKDRDGNIIYASEEKYTPVVQYLQGWKATLSEDDTLSDEDRTAIEETMDGVLFRLQEVVPWSVLQDAGLESEANEARRRLDDDPGGWRSVVGHVPGSGLVGGALGYLGQTAGAIGEGASMLVLAAGQGLGHTGRAGFELATGDTEEARNRIGMAGDAVVADLRHGGERILQGGAAIGDPFLRAAGADAFANTVRDTAAQRTAASLEATGLDQNADGWLNFREMLGKDPGMGGDSILGVIVGGADSLALLAIDPTTYMTGGAGTARRVGQAAVASRYGSRVADDVARLGIEAVLQPQQIARIQDDVLRMTTEALDQRRVSWAEMIARTPAEDLAGTRAAALMDELSEPAARMSIAGAPMPGTRTRLGRGGPANTVDNAVSTARQVADQAAGQPQLTTAAAKSVSELFSGPNTRVVPSESFAAPNGRQLSVSMDLTDVVDDMVVPVGNAEWTIDFMGDTARANLKNIDVAEEAMGSGHAARHIEGVIANLRRSDIDEILFTATGDGSKAWTSPRFGAEFANLGPTNRALLDQAKQMADVMARSTGEIRFQNLARDIDATLAGDLTRVTPADLAEAFGREAFDEFPDWAGRINTHGIPQILGEATPSAYRRAATAVSESAPARAFGQVFDSRSQMARGPVGRFNKGGIGAQSAAMVKEQGTRATAQATVRTNDLINRLGPLYARARRELSGRTGSADELNQLVQDVFEPGTTAKAISETTEIARMEARQARIAKAIDAAIEADQPALYRFLDTLADVDTELAEMHRLSGGDPRIDYMPRVVTDAGRDWLSRNETAAAQHFGIPAGTPAADIGEMMHSRPRVFRPNASISEVNDAARLILDIPEGLDLFENDALVAFAARGSAAFQAAARTDMIEQVAKITDELGNPLVFVDDGTNPAAVRKAAHDAGHAGEGLTLPGNRRIYGDSAVIEEISQSRRMLNDDAVISKISQMARNWNDQWGRYATSPLVKGTGFHSRNFIGNLWNNALAGVVRPASYVRAGRVQQHAHDIRAAMKREGMTFDEAADALRTPKDMRAILAGARDEGVFNLDFYTDVSRSEIEQFVKVSDSLTNAGPARRGAEHVRRGVEKATLVEPSQKFGTMIENNARLAHYIAKIDDGLSPALAAQSTRKYLFDYGDLTEVERRLFRSVSRFYTWSRKNIGLQLDTAFRAPGRLSGLQDAEDQMLGDDTSVLDEWMPDAGYRTGGYISGDMAAAFDTPLSGFENSVAGLLGPLEMIPGVGRDDVGIGDAAKGILNEWVTGGPVGAAQAMVEHAVNARVFEGDFIDPSNESGFSDAVEFIGFVLPVIPQATRQLIKTDLAGLAQHRPETQRALQWLEDQEQISDSARERDWRLSMIDVMLGVKIREFTGMDQGDVDATIGSPNFGIEGSLMEELEILTELGEKNGFARMNASDLRAFGIELWESDEAISERHTPDRWGMQDETRIEKLERLKDESPNLFSDLMADELEALTLAAEEKAARDAEAGKETTTDWAGFSETQSRSQRQKDWSLANGFVTEGGNGSTATLPRALYNLQNPDDQQLNDDGKPTTYWDVSGTWAEHPNFSMYGEVTQWVIDNGGTYDNGLTNSGGASAAAIRGYNSTHPDRPYISSVTDRLDAGIFPAQGVHEFRVDGVDYVAWPTGYARADEVDMSGWGPEGFQPEGFSGDGDRFGLSGSVSASGAMPDWYTSE